MKNKFLILSLALVSIIVTNSCEPEEVLTEVTIVQGGPSSTPIEEDEFRDSGFIASSFLGTSQGFSYFAGYTEEEPSGNIDLTQFSSFNIFFPQEIYKNLMFTGPLNSGDLEMNRIAVDDETGLIVNAGTIPLAAGVSEILVIDDDLGVFTIFNTQSVFLFNPSTMTLIEEIPMPQATVINNFDNQFNSYLHIIHRPQDNKLFLPLSTDAQITGAFYDATDIYVEVVDLDSRSWESTTVFTGATQPITRGMENPTVDENGNIYLLTQGQYGLDGQLGPASAPGSRPQILKIPAGSTSFDENYAFNPVNSLGLQNSAAQITTGMIYGGSGKAYAAMNAIPDAPEILMLLALLATGDITDQQLAELQNLVLNSPVMKWTELDLEAQTTTIIPGLPFTAGFNNPFSFEYDGRFYFQIFNPDEGLNGFYELDPETSATRQVYNIVNGGVATHFIKFTE
ncbi:MAG: hypothetical protein AAF688_04720 [Bacteroidota bacterium]